MRRGLAVGIVASGLSLPAVAANPPNVNDPAGFVASVGQEFVAALGASKAATDRRTRDFRKIFVNALDIDGMARLVLGRHWRKATDNQRQAYMRLFRDYVVNIYAVRLSSFGGERFTVLRQEPSKGPESVVTARITRGYGAPLDLSFRVRKSGDEFHIIDVTVMGVSLIVTKRSEFDAIIQREGLPGLLRRLNEKTVGIRWQNTSHPNLIAEDPRSRILGAVTILHGGGKAIIE